MEIDKLVYHLRMLNVQIIHFFSNVFDLALYALLTYGNMPV